MDRWMIIYLMNECEILLFLSCIIDIQIIRQLECKPSFLLGNKMRQEELESY